MADLNQNFDHEIDGSSAQEGDYLQQRLGQEFQEDIRATASFAPVRFEYNQNYHNNNHIQNMETSPITRIQIPNNNQNISHDMNQYSLRGSDMGNSQQYKMSGSCSIRNQNTPTYIKMNSLSSSSGANQAQFVKTAKSISNASNAQHQNLSNSIASNINNKFQNHQYYTAGYVTTSLQQQQSRNQGQQGQLNIQKQVVSSQQQQNQQQGSTQKQFNQSRTVQVQNQANDFSGSRQLSYQSGNTTQVQVNQRLNNPQLLNFRTQPIRVAQERGQVTPQQRLGSPINQYKQSDILQEGTPNNQQYTTNTVIQNRQNINNSTPHLQIKNSNQKPVLSRYFGGSSQQQILQSQQSMSSQQYINVGPTAQTFSTSSIKPLSQSSTPQLQIQRNIVNSNQIQNRYTQFISPPASPQNQFVQKPQSVDIPQNNLNQQQLRPYLPNQQQTIIQKPVSAQISQHLSRSPSPPQIIQSSKPQFNIIKQQPQPTPRQSRMMGRDQAHLQRRSPSYGSKDSRGKPPVYFTYTSNIVPSSTSTSIPTTILQVRPSNPSNLTTPQNQNKIKRQNTHTLIQKTTTIVWQQRYFTVIQRFNFICQRFDHIVRQIRIITQVLQKAKGTQNFEKLYHELIMRHTVLLQLLAQTQQQLSSFQSQNDNYLKQIQNDKQLKQKILYQQKYHKLELQNSQLKSQITELKQQLKKILNNKLPTTNNSDLQIQKWQQRMRKLQEQFHQSQTFNQQFQQYVVKLEQDNNMLNQQLVRYRNIGNQVGNSQYIQLIKNQQLIIRELQNELKKKQTNQGQVQVPGKVEDIQQYITAINSLQAKIKQLQQNSTASQYSQKKYTQIIQTQRNIIQNIQSHFKQYTQNSTYREEQLKNILHNQQSIINTLEQQLKRAKPDSGQVSKERQQQLLKQIEEGKSFIRQLQLQLKKQQQKNNQIKQELTISIRQVTMLKQQRISYQKSIQEKLEHKLVLIQQELRIKSGEQKNLTRPSSNSQSQQIQELIQENDRLVLQLRKRQQQKRKIQQQLINQQQAMRRKLMEKQSQLRLVGDRIAILQEENKKKLNQKDRKLKQLQQQIQNLNIKIKSNVSTPRNNQPIQSFENFSPNTNEIRNLKQKLSNKQQELAQALRQRQNTQKKYQALQTSYNSLDQENSKRVQQLMNLKRQLSGFATFQTQIKALTQTINKKNQQIIQLKTVSFEKSQLKIQFQSVKNERNNLKSTIHAKNQQIDKLKGTMVQLQNKIRESKQRQNMFPTSNQSLVEQLQVMYESVKKKQAQLNKIKQANQLLQTNVQELQYENQRSKAKIALLEKNVVHQKEESSNALKQYENKIKDLQTKAKVLEESQRNNKTTFNLQIQNMQNVIKEKDQALRKLQSQNKVFKNKLKNHQSKVQQFNTQIQNLNKKIKKVQTSKQEMKKQIENLETGNLANLNTKKLYDEYQIKIVELQAAIKVKDNKIKQLEEIIQTTKIKNNYLNTQEDFINQQQIQVLRKKVAQYESRLINYGPRTTYKPRQYQSTLVFEQRAIYQLKSQNQRLKLMISGKGIKYQGQQQSPNSKTNIDVIQKRLTDFNQKLQQMMEQNKRLQQKNPDFSRYLEPRHQNQYIERQRLQLIRKHKNQMLALQARLVDLQRYCSSFQTLPNNSSITFTGNTSFIENAKGMYAEQLNYYKQKNNQLQERIDSHIKLNKQLKQKLQGALKSGGDSSSVQFYHLQTTQLQKQIAQYLMKIKSLNDENKNLRHTLQINRNDSSLQNKVTQLQNKIHQLNRRNSQLQMQNGILQGDLNKYMQQFKNANDEVQKYKNFIQDRDQKLGNTQQNIRQANSKINNYEIQILKLNNQIKLLQAENQRLNEKLKNKNGQQNAEISRLKARLTQLQNQLREYQEHSGSWIQAKKAYQHTITSLNTRISNLECEVQRLNALYQNLIKKIKQTQAEYFTLQGQYQNQRTRGNDLQRLLKEKQLEIDSMHQFLQRIKMQRDNQGGQTKKRLTYILEMEETLKNLRIQLSQSKGQIQRLKSQNSQYRQKMSSIGSMEEVIKQLRLQIQLYKGQIERLKATIDQLKQKISINNQLQQNIQEMREQILRYRAQIQRLRRQKDENNKYNNDIQRLIYEIQQFEQQNQRLKLHIHQVENQLHINQQIIEGIAYRIQFIRSSFIEIQVLYGEISVEQTNRRQIQVLQRIKQNVTTGLKFCSEAFILL